MLTSRVAEGYRYFKLDFLWIKNLPTRHNQKKTRLEICRDVNKLYRESIGEDSYLLSCVGGLNRGCFGYADGARMGTDTIGFVETPLRWRLSGRLHQRHRIPPAGPTEFFSRMIPT